MTPSPVFLPLRELAALVRTRRVSPVTLAEEFLARLDALGPRYNAVVTVTRDRALTEARRAETEIAAGGWRGPLHGIPYGAKDLLATGGGIPTTWGAAPLRRQVFDADATVIRRLETAGAVLAAKLAMVELAGGAGYRQPHAAFTGPGRSPWGEDAWSGGSSSGSASAVAAGLVPFALGSETWGSIVSPAANCGVTGLRPTLGRVSRHGAMALSWSLDKIGPLGPHRRRLWPRAGGDRRPDPWIPARRTAPSATRRRIRPAAASGSASSAPRWTWPMPTCGCASRRPSTCCASLGTVEPTSRCRLFPYEAITRTILFAEAASALEGLVEEGALAELTAPEDRYGLYARDAILAKDYIKALRLRAVVARQVDGVLARLDALVAPGRFTVAGGLDEPFRSAFGGTVLDPMGAIGNAAGLPRRRRAATASASAGSRRASSSWGGPSTRTRSWRRREPTRPARTGTAGIRPSGSLDRQTPPNSGAYRAIPPRGPRVPGRSSRSMNASSGAGCSQTTRRVLAGTKPKRG